MRSLFLQKRRLLLLAVLPVVLLPVVLWLSAVTATTARADGLIRQLPADGTWIKYFTEVKITSPQEQTMTGLLVLRSVGTTTENGKACRWIEFDLSLDLPEQGDDIHLVNKLLIPEESIAADKDPLAACIRGWFRNDNQDTRPSEVQAVVDHRTLSLFFGPPPQEVNETEAERSFGWQRGTFAGRGQTWQRELDTEGGLNGTLDVTVWPSKEAPFGVAAMTTELDVENVPGLTIHIDMLMNDFGTDSKSVLAGHQ